MLDKILTGFASLWVGLVLSITVMIIANIIRTAPSFWGGRSAIQDEFSPFNVVHYLTVGIFLSPAALAILWRDKCRERHKTANQPAITKRGEP